MHKANKKLILTAFLIAGSVASIAHAENYYFRIRPSINILNQNTFGVSIDGDKSGIVGTTFSARAIVRNAREIAKFSVEEGHLPPGISLDSDSGDISGQPQQRGTFSSTIAARDAFGEAVAGLTIRIYDPINIAATTPRYGTIGKPYIASFLANGGPDDRLWTIEGTIPAGLSFGGGTDATTTLSGTPTTPGAFNLSVNVTGVGAETPATHAFNIAVANPPEISGTPSVIATAGTPYAFNFTTTGGHQPLNWSISQGSLPTGLHLSGPTLSGTPTAASHQTGIVVNVVDSAGNTASSAPFDINVAAPLVVSGTPEANGIPDTFYQSTLTATGGSGTYTLWTVTSGSLPPSLTLSQGIISGTPKANETGVYSGTVVTVTDSEGRTAASAPFSIEIKGAVTPGTWIYNYGSGSFVTPAYNTLIIEAFGEGGPGRDTTVVIPSYGTLFAGGGKAPPTGSFVGLPPGGPGGDAYGGDINIPGEAGWRMSEPGFENPNSYGGASGGLAYGGGGRAMPLSGGNSPGGGSGNTGGQTPYRPPHPPYFFSNPGYGGGGYSRKTFTKGQSGAPTIGMTLSYVVGNPTPTSPAVGVGGMGRVKITVQ